MLVSYVFGAYLMLATAAGLLTEYSVNRMRFAGGVFKSTRAVRIVLYAIVVSLPCFGAFLPDSAFKFFCMKWGNVWLGFFLYFTGLMLLCCGVTSLICRIKGDKDKKVFGFVLCFAAAAAALITSYGMIHARDTKIVTYDVKLSEAPQKELKAVLLADLHLSVNSSPEMTESMVEKVNACEPDVILIAGDIFTSTYGGLAEPERYSEALNRMSAKYGVYAVAGNHDVEEKLFGGFAVSPVSEAFRTPEMDRFFEDAGFRMLYDDTAALGDTGINIIGRKDGAKAGDGTKDRLPAEKLLSNVREDSVELVLEHEPLDYKELAENGADMVLSGHTHNGQIFPGNLIVPFFNENAFGYKELYGMKTIVTAGVGFYGAPMRVGTDSDISLISIKY